MEEAAPYCDFDPVALAREYSPSSKVANVNHFIAKYSTESAALRSRAAPHSWRTIQYGTAADQTLDIFLPTTTPAPLLVFIHGGYWQELGKDHSSFPAGAITGAGFSYAAINHTLAPKASLDEIIGECSSALAWLWRNRGEYGIDERGLVVSGHSAGAHLAAMMLTMDWSARAIAPSFIKAALLLGGIYDLEPIRRCYVNEVLALDRTAVERNSPMFLQPKVRCPLVVAWAEDDTDEFKRQSRSFISRWRALGVEAHSFELAGKNHFDALFDWMDPQSRFFAETQRLLLLI